MPIKTYIKLLVEDFVIGGKARFAIGGEAINLVRHSEATSLVTMKHGASPSEAKVSKIS